MIIHNLYDDNQNVTKTQSVSLTSFQKMTPGWASTACILALTAMFLVSGYPIECRRRFAVLCSPTAVVFPLSSKAIVFAWFADFGVSVHLYRNHTNLSTDSITFLSKPSKSTRMLVYQVRKGYFDLIPQKTHHATAFGLKECFGDPREKIVEILLSHLPNLRCSNSSFEPAYPGFQHISGQEEPIGSFMVSWRDERLSYEFYTQHKQTVECLLA